MERHGCGFVVVLIVILGSGHGLVPGHQMQRVSPFRGVTLDETLATQVKDGSFRCTGFSNKRTRKAVDFSVASSSSIQGSGRDEAAKELLLAG